METISKHFFRDMGVIIGRSISYIFRSRDAILTVTLIPILFILLFAYVFGCAILLALEMNSNNY